MARVSRSLSRYSILLNITYEEWSRVLAVNLTGPFLCAQAAAPLMRDSGSGAIVNVTSIQDCEPQPCARHTVRARLGSRI